MDLRLLEIFCCVYEEKSFSKAGKRLRLSQPTISGHIKALEDSVGTLVFDRLGRRIQATAAGELLYEQGHPIIDLKQHLVENMDRFLNRLEGQVSVGASNIPGEYLLPPVIGRFRRAHPKLCVRLIIGDSQTVIQGVKDGLYEVGFVGARSDQSRLSFTRFASDRLSLFAPRGAAWARVESLSLHELASRPLLIREPGSGTRLSIERRLNELGYNLKGCNVIAELGSTTAIKEAIKMGVGCSILSDLAVQSELAAGLLKAIGLPEFGILERDFYIVADPQRTRSPICSLFLDQFR